LPWPRDYFMNIPNAKPPIPWSSLSLKAAVVAALCVVASFFVALSPGWLLASLFLCGALAGAWGARQAWLAGLIVGMPFTIAQVTRWSALEHAAGSPMFWVLVPLVAVPATGIAIAGALSGSWVRNTR
jgi:hypothetical protein